MQNERAGSKNKLCIREVSTALHISLLSIFGKHCCSRSASGYHQTWEWYLVDCPIKLIDRLLMLLSIESEGKWGKGGERGAHSYTQLSRLEFQDIPCMN